MRESVGYFDAEGEFELNGGHGMRAERLPKPAKPVFSQPSLPLRLPEASATRLWRTHPECCVVWAALADLFACERTVIVFWAIARGLRAAARRGSI